MLGLNETITNTYLATNIITTQSAIILFFHMLQIYHGGSSWKKLTNFSSHLLAIIESQEKKNLDPLFFFLGHCWIPGKKTWNFIFSFSSLFFYSCGHCWIQRKKLGTFYSLLWPSPNPKKKNLQPLLLCFWPFQILGKNLEPFLFVAFSSQTPFNFIHGQIPW